MWQESDVREQDERGNHIVIAQSTKVIVFDLDGTLYEDTHHFDYYAKLIERSLPPDQQTQFATQYEEAIAGKHAVKVGRVYDAKRDLLLVQVEGEVIEAYRWDGTRLPDDAIAELYPEPIVLDLTDMTSIGDQWWIPPVIARHMGIPPESSYEMFEETRRWMMGPDFEMERIPGLVEQLSRLSQTKKLVVLTNSPQPDSEAILDKLGLSDVFDQKIFMGMKPVRSQEHFRQLAALYDCTFAEMLSVGDNWVNDIHQPRQLGCQTIFIDGFGVAVEDSADLVVASMRDVVDVLRTL